jgi:GNAT superfamily N-acetyltransferase
MDGSLADEAVILRDGSRVLVRPVRPDDKELFIRGWQRFGEESRYRRFMGAKASLTRRELAYFTEIDHVDHEALGAIDARTGDGVGVARMIRLPDQPEAAEAAVSVIDDWQGLGLGGVLLNRLTARAAELGIKRFTASLLATNHSMLALFSRLGHLRLRQLDAGEIEIDVALPVEETGLGDALRAAAKGLVGLKS